MQQMTQVRPIGTDRVHRIGNCWSYYEKTGYWTLTQGRPSPRGNDVFPPVSGFPHFRKNFKLVRNSPNLTFCHFHPSKFLMPFFRHRLQIWNFPLFSLFYYISPLFRKKYYFPLLFQIPLWFRKLYMFFYILSVFFVSPYFDHLCITQCTYWTPIHAWNPKGYFIQETQK